MIVVRNIFRLKFGKAKDAIAIWKEMAEANKKAGRPVPRILTDVTGTAYTLVLEFSYENLAGFEAEMANIPNNPDYRRLYESFIPLAETSYREILREV